MVKKYLTGPVLQVIKDLFKKIGITFTQKAAAKVIPFGIGVVVGGTANYALTKYVGKTARDTFRLSLKEEDVME
ncbi:EcsC protein family protein [compost metagenome]